MGVKSWIDLADNGQRAKTARHIAALSNHGGGYLIFGFNDDLTRCEPYENVRKDFSRDVFAGIVDKYLHPKFECKVYFLSHGGVEHAIVWIPPHGKSPVFTKKGGPENVIMASTIYVRTPKPESKPVSTSDEFEKIITRCVLAKGDELMKQFSDILSGSSRQPQDALESEIEQWHKAARNAFLAKCKGKNASQLFPLSDNYVEFSYSIIAEQKEPLSPDDGISLVDKLNNEVKDTVHYFWSMFKGNMGGNSRSYFNTDPAYKGGNVDFIEANYIDPEKYYKTDFWRISLEGKASLIRGFQEDCEKLSNSRFPSDQKYFDPWLHIRNITELVRHAKAFSNEFNGPTEVIFQIEFHGLKSRVIAPIDSSRYCPSDLICKEVNDRPIIQSFKAGQLAGEMPKIVKSLYEPVHRLFDPSFKITNEWIENLMPKFVM